jgi:hypothetical protein
MRRPSLEVLSTVYRGGSYESRVSWEINGTIRSDEKRTSSTGGDEKWARSTNIRSAGALSKPCHRWWTGENINRQCFSRDERARYSERVRRDTPLVASASTIAGGGTMPPPCGEMGWIAIMVVCWTGGPSSVPLQEFAQPPSITITSFKNCAPNEGRRDTSRSRSSRGERGT